MMLLFSNKIKIAQFIIFFVLFFLISLLGNTVFAQDQGTIFRDNTRVIQGLDNLDTRGFETDTITDTGFDFDGIDDQGFDLSPKESSMGFSVPSGRGVSYTPITPDGVPFVSGGGLGGLFVGLFKAGVTIAALLAVVMLIVGGIQYMGSESIFAKTAGKERIMAALGGLLIALTCVLLLGVIFGFGGGPNGGSFEINLNFD